ncbi:MAG: Lrp/AsnC family transcriptional regulator [Dehalococcoidia bacterium]
MTLAPAASQLKPFEQELLNQLQDSFPLAWRPFAEIGERLGASEADVMEAIEGLRAAGIVREISAIFDTRALGYRSSLVAMRVAPERLESAAAVVNEHPGVSHNYRRHHNFNLWFTIAVPPHLDLEKHVAILHEASGAESARLLPTIRMFKLAVTLDMKGDRAIDHQSKPLYTGHEREKGLKQPLTEGDVELVRAVQGDLPMRSDPLQPAAETLGLSPDKLLGRLAHLKEGGYLQRFAGILRHRKAGFGSNGMAVWAVPEERAGAVGEEMANFTSISHCYLRPTYEDWPYNLFSMIHARTRKECESLVTDLAGRFDLDTYDVLYSGTEFKMARLRYFTPAWDEWERAHSLTS